MIGKNNIWKRYQTLALGLLMVGTIACNDDDDVNRNDNPYVPITLEPKSASLVESSNSFGAEMFKQMLQDVESDENALISPLSIFQALSMTWNGAKEDTRQEMIDVLTFENSASEDVNPFQKKLTDALQNADNKLTLDIANSVWYRDGEDILADFKTVNEDNYNAEISALDFSDGEAAKTTINDWVDNHTNGKITEIVDEVSPEHVMFLINAIHFYGEWKYEFDATKTEKQTFTLRDETEEEVDMMKQTAELGYYTNDDFSMVELPYGNGHFNMVVMLPKGDNSVADVVEAINDDAWGNWMTELENEEVSLGLPKFSFEGDYELKDPLIRMGMPLAFSGAADFSGIRSGGGLYISRVRHKTFIEVDEKGTEAAAVTSVELEKTSLDDEPIAFTANRPFVFAITEKDTNAILFLGRYMQPE